MLSRMASRAPRQTLVPALGRLGSALRAPVPAPPRGAFRSVADMKAPQMMCYQCEQTTAGKGCVTQGVCSKTPQLAGLQDLQVLYNLHLCELAHAGGAVGELEAECRHIVLETTFATLTNVNFDDDRFVNYLRWAESLVQKMTALLAGKAPPPPAGLPATLPQERKDMFLAAGPAGLLARAELVLDEDVFGVVEMGTYGLKGAVAYFYHAEHLNAGDTAYVDSERSEVYQEIFRIGSYLAKAGSQPAGPGALNEALGECLAIGALNLKIMKMLDAAHNVCFGTPGPTSVTTQPELGHHSILVSGHDLNSLYNLLEQSKDKGIDVYTHGEMLSAHGYPKFREFAHLRGHYGTHWGNQLSEFRHFPGAILMTSNCLRPPTRKYADRLYTTGPVGFHNVPQVADEDYCAVIARSLQLPVFSEEAVRHAGDHAKGAASLQTGFGHAAVLGVADKVVEAVKSGALKHVFVIGGCDGTQESRNYFTDLALETPPDSLILTMGCGKFRLNHHDFGTLGGLPRLLDMGQCNDAYGAVVVAVKLAEALECKVHDLPLHFAVSWFEQKAVAVLLSLLHLELKNIRIGPAVPAFLTPNVIGVLTEKFGLKAADLLHEDDDISEMLQGR